MRSTASLAASLVLLALTITPAAAHVFTGTNGKKIEAEIKSATATSVELETPSGKIYNVPLTKLSKEDRFHISVWREQQAKSKALKDVKVNALMEANESAGADLRMASGLPAITLEIGGRQTTLVINTTIDRCLLLDSAAQESGLDVQVPQGQLQQGLKGIATVTQFGVGDKDVGQKIQFLVVAPELINEKIRQEAAGFIGFSFLQESGAVIDWAARKVWFPNAEAPEAEEEEENDDEDDDKEDDEDDDEDDDDS